MKDMIDILLQHPGIEAFGMAILHSLWQGTFVAVCLFVMLRFVRHNSNLRYILACGALVCLLLSFGYTLYLNYTPPVQVSNTSAEFSPSDYHLSEVIVPQSTEVYEEDTFLLAAYYAVISQWIGRYTHYIFALWLIGFLVFSSRLALGLYYAHQLKGNGQKLGGFWLQKLDKYRRTLDIKSKVRLLTSEHVHTPLTLGWIQPVILLPVSMLTQLPCEHLESILLHELAHIKRQDYLINLLQSVVETLLFFNPAYWYIARVIERERENACDDIAVGIIQQPVHYARALTRVAELSKADGVLTKATVAVNSGSLTNRIRRIVLGSVGQTVQRREKTKWYLLSITVLAVLAAILFTQEVKGFQSEKEVEKEIETDLDIEVETEEEIDLDIEEEVDIDLDIEIEDSLDLELDVDVQGAHLDSTSLYHFLFSQWEAIKKRKETMGEAVPDNVLLSDKTLYIVDGEARNPKTIKPPFDYTISIPHTVMWAAMMSFDFFDIEDSYAAFRKKYPGDYHTVVMLTSKAAKDEVDPDEPFTVTGQVINGSTDTPISDAKVLVKGTHSSTFTDIEGNYSIRVPNADAVLVFSHEDIYYSVEQPVKLNRDGKMSLIWYIRPNKLEKLPDIEVHQDYGNPQKNSVSFKETLNSSDTGTIKGTASAIVLEIDENRDDLPLYLVDGVEVSPAIAKKLDPQSLREIEIVQKEIAVKRYGEKGKHGVVLLTTKKAVQEGRVQISSLSNAEPPLFIIDGKQVNEKQFSLLKPVDIATLEVLKGEEAIQLYGNKGANGVVVIKTKSRKFGKEKVMDMGPSFQEAMDKATDGMLDTMTADEIHSYQLTLNLSLNRLQSGINQYAKEMGKPVSILNFSEDKVLYLLDGVKTNPQSINYYDVASLEVIRADAELSFREHQGYGYIGQQHVPKKIEDYTQKYPGDYEAVVVVTSRHKNSDQENIHHEKASDQEYFNTLKRWFDYFNDPNRRSLTESVGIKNLPMPNSHDGKPGSLMTTSSLMSVVNGKVHNWWLVKPDEVATVEVYQRYNPFSYFYHVENGYGHVSIDGKDKLEYLRKSYPGEYDELLIITTKKGNKPSNNMMEKSTASDHLKVFPNPSENIFTIQLTLAEDTPVQVSVIDAAGRLVTSLTDRSVGKGSLELKWDASGQKPGLYCIRIIQNGETTYRNVVVE